MKAGRASAATIVALACSGALSACGNNNTNAGAAPQHQAAQTGPAAVSVEVTSAGCTLKPAEVPAGAVNFTIKNTNAKKVTEVELESKSDEDILASRENFFPGATRTFSLWMKQGDYFIDCEGAAKESAELTVSSGQSKLAMTSAQQKAVNDFRAYLLSTADELVEKTKTFSGEIAEGDLEEAQEAYGPAHLEYEAVEFVGDLMDGGKMDTAIDGRGTADGDEDEDGATQFTGFHRLEELLFEDKSLAGTKQLATKLESDVAKFREALAAQSFQPAELANGAAASIDEGLQLHLPGIEDQASRAGLWDFAGKFEMASKVTEMLDPIIEQRDPALAAALDKAMDTVGEALSKLRQDGRYLDYDDVSQGKRNALIAAANKLDGELSKVPAVVV